MPSAGSSHPSPHSSQGEHRTLDDVEDDKQSTMSRASGIPRAEHALDALRLVAGDRVRHARCAPEFLEEIATKGVHQTLKRTSSKNCKVICGSDARSAFKDYMSQHNAEESKAPRHDDDKLTNHDMPSPIVFAVTVWEAGNKCVDYYMTWRGNPKARKDKDFERKFTLFDEEFRRLAKSLDREYKKISSLRTYHNLSRPRRGFEKKSSVQSFRKPRPPPDIVVSTPDEPVAQPQDQGLPTLPEPPVSATDSVMSLPLLNMIRNVPFGNRVLLRVTNPDRLSMISETNITPEGTNEPPATLDTMINMESDVSNKLAVPVVSRSPKHIPNDDGLKKSSASIRSFDTKSSKSSRSSRSSSRSENVDSSRTPSPTDQDKSSKELPEFLIIFLGDNFGTDANSWHGLERQSSIRSLPPDRHSPWIEIPNHKYIAGPTSSDSDSEESDGEDGNWKHPPVIPMKPLIEAMGFSPNASYYRSPPVIPGGLQYQVSIANAASPASPHHSPYLYSSPRLDSSPYLPPWLPQLQIPPHAPSRPSSRAYSSASYASPAASYASPYMQSHTGPF